MFSLCSWFPNLKFLTTHNCGLKRITRKDLIGFDNTFLHNDLTTLRDDLFADVKNSSIYISIITNWKF